MNENSLNKEQNLTILKQTSFISNTDQNISTNHTFKTIKKRIPWSEEEDKSIKSLVNKYGTSNWTFISNQMGQNRSGKQCRERWYNQLNPNMKKNNWTNEEENILFTKHMQLGNKWSDIASFLPGRTLNDIKNHFYSKLRKFIRKTLKQINDENLFKINGIDGCKYNGEKIYKMIKQYEITYKNLTKDTIFEMIIATEKNPKGKIIFNNDNSNINIDNNTYNSNYINLGNNYFFNDTNEEIRINKDDNYNNLIMNNNLFMNLNNYQKINEEIKEKIINENNIDKQLINNNNNSKMKLKFKLEKKESKLKKRKNMELNLDKENINIKEILNNQGNKNKIKDNTNVIKDNYFSNENNNNNNKLIGHKRKKITHKKTNNLNLFELNNNSKKDNIINGNNNCPNLLLSEEVPLKQKLKDNNVKNKKRKNKNASNKEINEKQNLENQNIDNNNQKNNNEIKFISKVENKEKNNFCFYSPFKISTPKTGKNIIFPTSDSKPEDFSFNKLNSLNENLDFSQIQQIFPGNMELFFPQKNKNIFISDLSYDNILKSRGSCLGSIKNDNTYKNLSIDGYIYNKMLIQNNNINKSINNNMTFKSIDENNILDEKNDINLNKKIDKPNINLDLINHQDFTNTFINGNMIGGNESQYNSIFNKNNPIYNSSPSSMKSIWK